jgi:small-conductance mechanosensitive channel
MISQLELDNQLVIAATFVLTGLIIGLISELIILRRIRRATSKAKWQGSRIIFNSLRGMPFLWFTMIGTYGALINLEIDQNLFNFLLNGLYIIITLSLVLIIARVINGFTKAYTGRIKGVPAATSIITNVTNFTLLFIAFLIIVNSLGIDVTPLLTLLGVGGLTIALALQPTLSNLFAGLYLLTSREYEIGDYIKLDSGEEGYISDMTWHHTIIKPPAGHNIVIPNSQLFSATIRNFGVSETETLITIPLGVGYDSDLIEVEEITVKVASEIVKKIQGEFSSTPPYIRYHTFAPSSIDFQVNIYAKNRKDHALIRHEFIKAIFKKYQEEKIDIPYPHTVILSKEG